MGRRPLVMVADSVLPTLRLITEVLEEELGVRVVELTTAEELLRQVQEVRSRLIVMELDARRPGDLESLRRLRLHSPAGQTPVLALVIESPLMTCEMVSGAGATVCLSKPFELDELLEHATEMLERSPAAV